MTHSAILAAAIAQAAHMGVIVVDDGSGIEFGVKHEHLLSPPEIARVERAPRKRSHPAEEQKRLKRLGKRMRK